MMTTATRWGLYGAVTGLLLMPLVFPVDVIVASALVLSVPYIGLLLSWAARLHKPDYLKIALLEHDCEIEDHKPDGCPKCARAEWEKVLAQPLSGLRMQSSAPFSMHQANDCPNRESVVAMSNIEKMQNAAWIAEQFREQKMQAGYFSLPAYVVKPCARPSTHKAHDYYEGRADRPMPFRCPGFKVKA